MKIRIYEITIVSEYSGAMSILKEEYESLPMLASAARVAKLARDGKLVSAKFVGVMDE